MFFTRNAITWTIVIVSALIILILNLFCKSTEVGLVTSVLGSIIASFAVSSFYNIELHKVSNRYLNIGINQYYESFEQAQDLIRKKIEKGKEVDILFMYGSSFFNSSSGSIKKLLQKKDTVLRIFLTSESNLFLEGYGKHWGEEDNQSKYNNEGLKVLINQSKNDFINLYKGLGEEKGKIEIYEIPTAPVSYSFYRIDDDLFFVPSKNTKDKLFKPSTFHFVRTEKKSTLFARIESEINIMIKNGEVNKIFGE